MKIIIFLATTLFLLSCGKKESKPAASDSRAPEEMAAPTGDFKNNVKDEEGKSGAKSLEQGFDVGSPSQEPPGMSPSPATGETPTRDATETPKPEEKTELKLNLDQPVPEIPAPVLKPSRKAMGGGVPDSMSSTAPSMMAPPQTRPRKSPQPRFGLDADEKSSGYHGMDQDEPTQE